MDLKAMSSAELKQLQADLKQALDARLRRDLWDAEKAAEKAVEEYGFSLEQVFPYPNQRPSERRMKKAPPKYRNPENPEETWTGRGRKPRWITEALAKGRDISELEI
ncbi:H-NS histone family protein [Leisingera sp. JC1]|uniref:H-NS histone family protein n=1 Tax=Leisingera sp. JC1 TaxID=1855282 RepID=UPI000807F2ED|nr:H-NS histone family protein [Leisingera sp. JC1]OBY24830.1 transcriptional regulator [Leisingera sp. JC1]